MSGLFPLTVRPPYRKLVGMRTLGPTLLLVLVPLMAGALALGAYLNYASVRNTYLAMVEARQAAAATRIAEDAEMGLSMGLPLAGQDALERGLVREREADPMIAAVDVVSAGGRILFSSDPQRQGREMAVLPEAARVAPIASPFGTDEGRVVVSADAAALAERLDVLWRTIAWTAGVAFLLGSAAIAAVVLVTVRLLGRRLLRRGRTASGEMVPEEALRPIAAVDEAHQALARRLALAGR